MKKTLAFILCAVICISGFTACTKSEALPLADIYESLLSVPNMPEMAVMPDELIETLFGLDVTKFEEYVFAEAADPSVNADSIIMLKLKSADDLSSVCEALDAYLMSTSENTKSYSPVNYEKTTNSAVSVSGNYVYLVITTEYFDAVQIISDAIDG